MEYNALPGLKEWATLRLVVERGGVQEAANAMRIGQPAVSKRLRLLEEFYGVSLLEKKGTRLHLTQAGEKLYHLAVRTLDCNSDLLHSFATLGTSHSVLRLDASPGIGEHFLPHLLLEFAKIHPACKVMNCFSYSREIQIRLATGQSDVGLLENAPDHPDILVQKWMDDDLWLVCGHNHVFREKSIDVRKITALSFVLREEKAVARLELAEALHAYHIGPLNIAMEVGSCKAIVDILRHDEHMSFLPRFIVEEDVRKSRLRHIPVRGLHIRRMLWIARHRNQIKNPVADAFIRIVRQIRSDRHEQTVSPA